MVVHSVQVKDIKGLTTTEVLLLQKKYGKNIFQSASGFRFLNIVKDIFFEPMFILLAVACSLYFILGEINEGIMMGAAIALVTAISLYQEVKSSKALQSLQQFTEPGVTVIRDGKEQVISTRELVPEDILLLEEGMKVPADAVILQANDLSINESIISGESLPVEKHETAGQNILYLGTTINSGKCVAKITATGNNTVLGKIGKAISVYSTSKTPLQIQVNKFVKKLALFGLAAFLVIFCINYFHYGVFVTSLLFALTLAMSAVPEEIPVAFSSFMALGAYKLSKLGIITRQAQIIENLGAVTVLCLDKTGTITENKMQVKAIYSYADDRLIDLSGTGILLQDDILLWATLASETNPFDPMEKAIVESYSKHGDTRGYESYKMIFEYPLEGRPPMMTHVYNNGISTIAAAKGAAERIVAVCKLDAETTKKILIHTRNLGAKGYRIIGVAGATPNKTELPGDQDDFKWEFKGLLALYDPPKENVGDALKKISAAGIEIKLLTGDYSETAINIAGQVGIVNHLRCVIGEEIMNMNEEELSIVVKTTTVFARMFPDAKVKVITALKKSGEIVAMTGDGVNDGPALKISDIGIAMGKKGTETARLAADLVLTDDNIEKIVTAIYEGRKIFSNLVKAIRYIISIHIPIILTASLPLILGWKYPNIFTPVHVIFLELIMGPTCSIFFEKEPVEENNMGTGTRKRAKGLFTTGELITSIVQGLIITAGVLTLYYIFMNNQRSIEETRTIVFTTLVIGNVFLTFADRSFTKTIYHTSRYKNVLAPFVIILSSALLVLLHFVPSVRNLFQLSPISAGEFWICFATAFASVVWFEVYKMAFLKAK